MSLKCHASAHDDLSESGSAVNDCGDEDNTRCGGAAAAIDADATGEDSGVRHGNPLSRGGAHREGETENAETDEHELVTGPVLGWGRLVLDQIQIMDWTKPGSKVSLYSGRYGATEYCLAGLQAGSDPGIPGHWTVSEVLKQQHWMKRESDSSSWVHVDPKVAWPHKIMLLNGVEYDVNTGKHAKLGSAWKTAKIVMTGAQ